MEILTKAELNDHKNSIMKEIEINGKIIIYPTDTIYGIGCNAHDEEAVKKIRTAKGRGIQPFSIIVPSIDWIKKNCDINSQSKEWLKKLPGPYTLIFNLKNGKDLAKSLNPGISTIGVRIPNHWISDFVKELGIPLVTTSANRSGQDPMKGVDDLHDGLKKVTSYLIDEGELHGRPSKLVNLTEKEVKIIER